jgi:hypothetical protein
VLFAFRVNASLPLNVLAFVKLNAPAPVEVNEFSVAERGTEALTVKGFAPAWVIALIPVPIAPESVEVEVLVPTFRIDPV